MAISFRFASLFVASVFTSLLVGFTAGCGTNKPPPNNSNPSKGKSDVAAPSQLLDTATVIQVADAFLASLTGLKQASSKYQSNVSAAVESAKTELSTSDAGKKVKVDLGKVAGAWEEKWKLVDEQTAELQSNFQRVKKASTNYWQKLDQVTEAIRDPALRGREVTRNKEAKTKWDEAYQNAEKQMHKATALRDRGHDFHNVMLASALRRQIAEYTSTLNSIAEEAANLLKELEVVTEQGKSIIGV